MMTLRLWARYFKHALINISTNRMIHAISVGTISISMVLFGAFVLFFVNINNLVMEWGHSTSMSVYLKDGIEKDARQRIESALINLPGAEFKGFISKEKAMSDLMETLGPQSGVLAGLTKNPLPASFEIVFKDVQELQLDPRKIKEELEKIEGVDEVQYSEQWLERFEAVIYIIKLVGLVVGSLLCVAVLFIITNTIKLAIYSRRDEIEIYKLVGATDWFVKAPFLIEGAIQGIIGALFALLILFGMYWLFSLKTIRVSGLPLMDIVFLPNGHMIFMLALGLVLGLMGSFVAIGRFFRFFD
ncbi:MAG: permease-like cell division protein FtsX [Desulfobacterales bacterium]|nr:permease-like cell division protein FtsX [Desulfobacterales bacterium]